LSSALVTTEIDYLIAQRENPRGLKKEHIQLWDRINAKQAEYKTSENFLSWAIVNWMDFTHTQEALTKLTTALKIAQHALRVSIKDYVNQTMDIHITPTLKLTLLYKAKNNFDKVLDVITYSAEFHQQYQLGKHMCDAYGNLHLMWYDNNKRWLITHSHLVALRDVINSWFSVTLYGLLADKKYPGYSLSQEIGKYIHAGRELHKSHGPACYKLYKVWPSIVIACVLKDTECKSTLYGTLMKDITEYNISYFYKLATSSCTDDTFIQHLELVGLWKCFGHPDINMNKSVATWLKKGAAMKSPVNPIAQQLVWAFRLEFCRQFYKQKRK